MPLNKAILKEQLAQLSKKELAEMVLKLAGKRYNYEFLLVNFLVPIFLISNPPAPPEQRHQQRPAKEQV